MPAPEPSEPELKGLEAALAALVPQPSTIDRDRLMFEAGRAARSTPSRLRVPALVVSLGLAVVVGRLSVPTAAEPGITTPQAAPPAATATIAARSDPPAAEDRAAERLADPASYFQLRRHLGDDDLAAVDDAHRPHSAQDAISRRALLRELLN